MSNGLSRAGIAPLAASVKSGNIALISTQSEPYSHVKARWDRAATALELSLALFSDKMLAAK